MIIMSRRACAETTDMMTGQEPIAKVSTAEVVKRYATVDERSAFSGLSTRTLRGWIAEGKLTAYRPKPGRAVIDLRELDMLIQDSRGRPGTRGKYPRERSVMQETEVW